MTPIINNARVAEATPITAAIETAAAEQVLRDVAYVLRLTRRVKDEMMADLRSQPQLAERHPEGVLVA
jgi:hypothetical protein